MKSYELEKRFIKWYISLLSITKGMDYGIKCESISRDHFEKVLCITFFFFIRISFGSVGYWLIFDIGFLHDVC